MSKSCLYCNTPIEQKEGKRERKFCSPSHCTMFHLKDKKKDKPKGKQGRPKGSPNKVTKALKQQIATNNQPENKERIENERNKVEDKSHLNDKLPVPASECWDFSKVVFLQIEDFTEYPKSKCPEGGFERTEYLSKKKEADDKIREAFRIYKLKK